MTAPNQADILDEAPTEVKLPPVLPEGTYTAIVFGPPNYDKYSTGTDYVEFTFKITGTEADVDEDEIEAMGGVNGRTIKRKFSLTEDSVFILDQFHVDCGIDLADSSSRRVRNDEVINSEVRLYIKHKPSKDKSRVYPEIAKIMAAD